MTHTYSLMSRTGGAERAEKCYLNIFSVGLLHPLQQRQPVRRRNHAEGKSSFWLSAYLLTCPGLPMDGSVCVSFSRLFNGYSLKCLILNFMEKLT